MSDISVNFSLSIQSGGLSASASRMISTQAIGSLFGRVDEISTAVAGVPGGPTYHFLVIINLPLLPDGSPNSSHVIIASDESMTDIISDLQPGGIAILESRTDWVYYKSDTGTPSVFIGGDASNETSPSIVSGGNETNSDTGSPEVNSDTGLSEESA